MTISRIYIEQDISPDSVLILPKAASHHVGRVLRLRIDEPLSLFNGQGGEYPGRIKSIDRHAVQVAVGAFSAVERESPLHLTLAQSVSRGERMDLTIQKAVELGVQTIVPLITQRTTVKLDQAREQKRLQHWQSIIISACEQSGRNRIPELLALHSLDDWLKLTPQGEKFILSGTAAQRLASQARSCTAVTLIAGPEGGFLEDEVCRAEEAGYIPLRLGPRILRTETAALAAISALQLRWGDFDQD